MGASQSVSGHFAHREGWRHRLRRVASNETRYPCGMCAQHVELGDPAYRCRGGCTFVLHDACYRRRKEMAHFAHSGKGHHLTLTDGRKVPSGRSCGICAVPLDDDGGFVYGCGKCGGFFAHSRCCGLPQTVHNDALHANHPLTLLPPPQTGGGAKNHHRRCLNKAGKCNNAKRLDSTAWSYQCNICNVELCLECQLPGGAAAAARQHGGGGNVHQHLEAIVAEGQVVAAATGTILHSFCCTLCLGGAAMPPPTTASR